MDADPDPPRVGTTRTGSGRCGVPRWHHLATVRPWLTSFVDCTPGRPGGLLGLAPGRTDGCVRDWLGEQSEAFRRQVEIVVIDPSAPYASGIRAALPGVKIAVDKWHLVALANTMVTEVRQRVTRALLGRRGTARDPVWVNRRLLLTGAEHGTKHGTAGEIVEVATRPKVQARGGQRTLGG